MWARPWCVSCCCISRVSSFQHAPPRTPSWGGQARASKRRARSKFPFKPALIATRVLSYLLTACPFPHPRTSRRTPRDTTFLHDRRRPRNHVTPKTLKPVDEPARLATLRSKFVLDTAPDDTLDALVNMCAEIFDVPVAMVSLVDERRQWFKARKNFAAAQSGRAESFCAWTTLCIERKVLVVRDATADAKFRDNPLVTGDPGVRFYAGAPLVVDGVVLGALCLIDFEPHEDEAFFDEAAAHRLRTVAQTVAAHLARPCFSAWLGAAIETVREGVLLLEHAETRRRDARDHRWRSGAGGVFDSVDEYTAAEALGDAPGMRGSDAAASAEPLESEETTEKVVFANAAAKRMMRVGCLARRQSGERCASADVSWRETRDATGPNASPAISRRVRNPSAESFVQHPPRVVEGLDLVRAFPGPPETAATLARVSELLAEDAARRRHRHAFERGEVCENSEALMQGKARKESSSQSRSLARSGSTKSMLVDTEDEDAEILSPVESLSRETGERARDDAGNGSPLWERALAPVPRSRICLTGDDESTVWKERATQRGRITSIIARDSP